MLRAVRPQYLRQAAVASAVSGASGPVLTRAVRSCGRRAATAPPRAELARWGPSNTNGRTCRSSSCSPSTTPLRRYRPPPRPFAAPPRCRVAATALRLVAPPKILRCRVLWSCRGWVEWPPEGGVRRAQSRGTTAHRVALAFAPCASLPVTAAVGRAANGMRLFAPLQDVKKEVLPEYDAKFGGVDGLLKSGSPLSAASRPHFTWPAAPSACSACS